MNPTEAALYRWLTNTGRITAEDVHELIDEALALQAENEALRRAGCPHDEVWTDPGYRTCAGCGERWPT